jgi:hypothetical protein
MSRESTPVGGGDQVKSSVTKVFISSRFSSEKALKNAFVDSTFFLKFIISAEFEVQLTNKKEQQIIAIIFFILI